jgi:hypothetical protein
MGKNSSDLSNLVTDTFPVDIFSVDEITCRRIFFLLTFETTACDGSVPFMLSKPGIQSYKRCINLQLQQSFCRRCVQNQGCQMVYAFSNQSGHLVHFVVIWYILWSFSTFLGPLVHIFPFW